MPRKLADTDAWYIVGLGNPGREYANTRHNLGFSVLQAMANQSGAAWRYKERYSYCSDHDSGLFLIRPLTYMNLSGQAVKLAMSERRFSVGRLLVVCDDINLPLGRLRLRMSGSHGGQKGLKSIIKSLRTDDFARLRLGIGPLPQSQGISDFVLEKFSPEEYPLVKEMTARAAEAIIKITEHGPEMAMNFINQKTT